LGFYDYRSGVNACKGCFNGVTVVLGCRTGKEKDGEHKNEGSGNEVFHNLLFINELF
jgi:hypothetical protein